MMVIIETMEGTIMVEMIISIETMKITTMRVVQAHLMIKTMQIALTDIVKETTKSMIIKVIIGQVHFMIKVMQTVMKNMLKRTTNLIGSMTTNINMIKVGTTTSKTETPTKIDIQRKIKKSD